MDFTELDTLFGGVEAPPESTPHEEIAPLQNEADRVREEREQWRAVCAEYQRAIIESEDTVRAITRGLREGVDITFLFLLACRSIALLTSNRVFYQQVQDTLLEAQANKGKEQIPKSAEAEQTAG